MNFEKVIVTTGGSALALGCSSLGVGFFYQSPLLLLVGKSLLGFGVFVAFIPLGAVAVVIVIERLRKGCGRDNRD